MRRWRIEKPGYSTEVVGERDIWTAQGYTVTDLGAELPPPSGPAVLSATAFMDMAIAGLRALGLSQGAAEARFQEIVEAAKNRAGTAEIDRRVRYAAERYAKADKFNKAVVANMLTLFVTANVASITAGERTAILDAWPLG